MYAIAVSAVVVLAARFAFQYRGVAISLVAFFCATAIVAGLACVLSLVFYAVGVAYAGQPSAGGRERTAVTEGTEAGGSQ